MSVYRVRAAGAGTNEGSAVYSNTAWPPNAGTLTTNLGVLAEKTLSAGSYTAGVGLVRFDTSKIPDDATAVSAFLSLGQASKTDGADNKNLLGEYYDYGGDPPVAGDWAENIASSIWSAYDLANFAAFSPNNTVSRIPLTDLSGISLTGTTGIRLALSSGTPTVVNRIAFVDDESALEVFYTRGTPVEVDVDAYSEVYRSGTTDPQTWTHNPVGTPDGVLVMIIHGTSSTDHVSTVTYGGVSLSRVVRATDSATELGAAEIWFLGSGVPAGSATVSVDLASATTDDIHFVAVTLVADGSDLEIQDSDSINDNVANPSVTLQYGGNQCMAFAALYNGGSGPTGFTPNSNCEEVHSADFGAFYSYVLRQTTPGTSDFAVGGTASTDDVAYVAVAVRRKVPITGAVSQTFSFNVDTAGGQRTTFGVSQQTFAFNVATVGRKVLFGAASYGIVFGVSTDGVVDTFIRGSASTTFNFNVSVDSKRERFASASPTFVFDVDSAGVRGQLGQVQTTFAVGITSAGQSTRRGAASYGISFNASTHVDPDYPILDPLSEASLELTQRSESSLDLTAESEDSSLHLTPLQEQSP